MCRNSKLSFYSLLLTLLFCGIAFASTIPTREVDDFQIKRSAPQSLPRGGLLFKRDVTPPVPDIATCRGKLTVPRDHAVFYSSKVENSASAWASANGKHGPESSFLRPEVMYPC